MHCLILEASCHIYLNVLALDFFPFGVPDVHIYNLAVIFLKCSGGWGAIEKAIPGFVTYKWYERIQVT